jgi:hypothetical protein
MCGAETNLLLFRTPSFWLERAKALESNIKAHITDNPIDFFSSICQAFIDDTTLDPKQAQHSLNEITKVMTRRRKRIIHIYDCVYSLTGVGEALEEMSSILSLANDIVRALEDIGAYAILGEDELIQQYNAESLLFQKIWELVYV